MHDFASLKTALCRHVLSRLEMATSFGLLSAEVAEQCPALRALSRSDLEN